MRLIAPFGFYGWGNIGDEATLQGFARLLRHYDPTASAWVGSRDPQHTARAEPYFRYFKAPGASVRRWWANRRAHGAVFVGGTPIMDVLGRWPLSEVAPLVAGEARLGTPVTFVGIGTERLHLEESRQIVARELAPRVRHWSVRSERDRERLLSCGVPAERVTVAADLAWTLERSGDGVGSRQVESLRAGPGEVIIAVNVTNERFVGEQAPKLFTLVAEFLDRLIEGIGARVVFFCNEIREEQSFDKAASQLVIESMRHPGRATILPNEYRTPQEVMALLGHCRLAVGMRYHFCVFAAIQGVPFIAIKRSDKVDDLCRDLSWRHGLGLEEVDASRLEALATDLLADGRRTVESILARVESMRDRVWRNCVALDALRERPVR
jgi:polysaccharide pyruvyl transferase WcaK-like protein